MDAKYETLTTATAIDYIQRNCPDLLKSIPPPLVCVEFGNGNLNLVFKITTRGKETSSQGGASSAALILKQAVPYARCVGESWPLSVIRTHIEAQTLIAHRSICPDLVVEIFHANRGMALMVMEDLSSHTIWRDVLVSVGQQHPSASPSSPTPLRTLKICETSNRIAEYTARCCFFFSDFYLGSADKKNKSVEFMNLELCKLTEDLFFSDPYTAHDRNKFHPDLLPDVAKLRRDDAALQGAALSKLNFMTKCQTLLHGDLHTGSIFIAAMGAKGDTGTGSVKVIDGEFGFYGPFGFDIGTVLGNLMLAYAGHCGLSNCEAPLMTRTTSTQPSAKAGTGKTSDSVGGASCCAIHSHLTDEMKTLWTKFDLSFRFLLTTETQDDALRVHSFQEWILSDIFKDAVRYAGCELIRRTVGLAHVADLEEIPDPETRLRCERLAIVYGRRMLKASESVKTIDEVIALVVEGLGEAPH